MLDQLVLRSDPAPKSPRFRVLAKHLKCLWMRRFATIFASADTLSPLTKNASPMYGDSPIDLSQQFFRDNLLIQ